MNLNDCPIVSVIIPTRNRIDDLLVTLDRLERMREPGMEILVYDDASDTDPRPVLAGRFPSVRTFRSDRRVGPCELRNRLVNEAAGPIIVGLDDDSAPEDATAFDRIVRAFRTYPRLGLLSCRIRTEGRTMWPAERGPSLRRTASFIACGFAARRDALLAVGGFDADIFRAGEERDLVIRLLDAGYEVRQADDIVVVHRESPSERDHQFIHTYALRNELLFILKRVPARCVPGRLARQTASHVRFCAIRRWWRAMRGGFAGFVREAPTALRKRKAVRMETWRHFVAAAE